MSWRPSPIRGPGSKGLTVTATPRFFPRVIERQQGIKPRRASVISRLGSPAALWALALAHGRCAP